MENNSGIFETLNGSLVYVDKDVKTKATTLLMFKIGELAFTYIVFYYLQPLFLQELQIGKTN